MSTKSEARLPVFRVVVESHMCDHIWQVILYRFEMDSHKSYIFFNALAQGFSEMPRWPEIDNVEKCFELATNSIRHIKVHFRMSKGSAFQSEGAWAATAKLRERTETFSCLPAILSQLACSLAQNFLNTPASFNRLIVNSNLWLRTVKGRKACMDWFQMINLPNLNSHK